MPTRRGPLRVLFVAQAVSLHTARWISQLKEEGWDLHVFDMLGSFPHPELQGVTEYSLLGPRKIPILTKPADYGHPFFLEHGWDPFPLSLVGFGVRRLFRNRLGRLVRLIEHLRPDIIHSIELQTESYHLIDAADQLGGLGAPWIVSTWGSDMFYFQNVPGHMERISKLLSMCNYLIPDCHRDEALARSLGFKGEIPLILPGHGGYPIDDMRRLCEPGPVAARRLIMVKGYHGWAGRALDVLEALALCANDLRQYEIVVYFASDNVKKAAERLRAVHHLNIRILPRSPHQDVLRLFGKARLAIGVNATDGVPNAMLESMVMGALPIQSDTESTTEWITQGQDGLLVRPGDPTGIADAIRRGLWDDSLVGTAAELNARKMSERLDIHVIRPRVVEMYRRVAAGGRV